MKCIKATLVVLTVLFVISVHAQVTEKERAKTDSLTKLNYQQTLQSLGVKLPVLPQQADDPARPKNAVARANGNGYTDVQGRSLPRSPWGTWVNYSEELANNYTLPDPLVLKNGKLVASANVWWKQRRQEIVNDYETFVFGRVPKNTPKVKFELGEVDKIALDGNAIKQTITGHIDNAAYPAAMPVINLVLYLPAKANGPVPLMVIASSNTKGNNETIKLLINAGWAIAYFDTNGVQADNGAGLSEGIIGLVNQGKLRGPEDWGVLRAWSWGLSRALDYFMTDKAINPKQIGIEGHSRWGKTALLAGAMDQRWAIVFASCSGSGGASLEKRNFGENLDLIAAENEYHWMAPNFIKYGGNWKAFPVDAHEMMALVTPRPLFVTVEHKTSGPTPWANSKPARQQVRFIPY